MLSSVPSCNGYTLKKTKALLPSCLAGRHTHACMMITVTKTLVHTEIRIHTSANWVQFKSYLEGEIIL